MRVAIYSECAGFAPGEADMLRKSMATFKFTGSVSHFRDKLIAGMVANGCRAGVEADSSSLRASAITDSRKAAASFALIAYASAAIAEMLAPGNLLRALLNSGCRLLRAGPDHPRRAQSRRVEIHPVCANASRWDCTLEPTGTDGRLFAIRLGMRASRGSPTATARRSSRPGQDRPFGSVDDLAPCRRAVAALCSDRRSGRVSPALRPRRQQASQAIELLETAETPRSSPPRPSARKRSCPRLPR